MIYLFLFFAVPILTYGQTPSKEPEGDAISGESGDEIIARETFYNMRRAGGPGKSIPDGAYETAMQQTFRIQKDRNTLNSITAAYNWVSVNPTGLFYNWTGANYISGRTNAFAFHPTDPNTFYIAAAGGGVWKTIDGGAHFQSVTDNLSALTSGAVAVDPTNPNIIYVGTGELNYSLDSYYGDGVYKSTDAGSTWTKIATTTYGKYITAIVINPSNSNIVYIAGSAGVYKSTNGGSTWAYTNSNTYANTLIMDPTNPLILYTTTGYYNSNIIRKTTDGGNTWTTLTNGLPTSGAARTALAISASNPNVLYASISNNTNYGLLGLYRTTDAGVTWTLQNSSTNYLGGQGWYDNAVTVHPTNPDMVFVGGLDIYSSTNAGVTLTQKTSWWTYNSNNMSHADIHFLGYNGTVLYCGSDGGVYKSLNNGTNWSDMNATLSTLQFQSADYDPTNLQRIYGGCQDNDKETTTNGGTLWIQRTTGDGGYTVVDPVNTNYVYGQYVNGSVERSNDYGVSYTEFAPTGSSGGLFYNPYEMAPGDHNTIIFGRADVWKTTSDQTATSASGWTQIATSATIGGNVSSIGISNSTTNKIYIGTSNGKVLVTTDNGANWTLSTSGVPYVSDLAVDRNNDAICYAVFGGFNASTHIYKTTNSGTTWTNITGNLPNIPVISIAIRHAAPRMIFLGTDLGVYKSTDEGATWVSFNNGLPAVEVFDLKYKESTNVLLAATHGRGCFTFDLSVYAVQRTLSLNSLNPASGVPLTVTPNDINGSGDGSTPFTRIYFDNSTATITAPLTQGGNYFSKWIKDGVDLTVNQTTSVLMDTNHTLTAYYALSPTLYLNVTSTNPNSGVNITMLPADVLSRTDGTTPFTRYYYTSGNVSLTAPLTSGGNYFIKWQMDGTDYSTHPDVTINMDVAHTMNAVYGASPLFTINRDTVNFGLVKAKLSKFDSVVVTNTGNATLTITSITSNRSFFNVTPTSGSIASAGSQTFYVSFQAPTINSHNIGVLIFNSNAVTSPDSIVLIGDSYHIFSAQPDTINFGDIFVGNTKDDSTTISVDTNLTMNISSVIPDNNKFSITPTSSAVNQLNPIKFYVAFHPTTNTTESGHIIFTHDQTGSPDTVVVTGRGVTAGFLATPTSISFGNVMVSTSKTDSLVISNPETGTLDITSIESDNPTQFSVITTAPLSILPLHSQKIYIQFNPQTIGGKTGHIIFSHNAATSPDSIHVDGNGITSGFSAVPATIDFGDGVITLSKLDSITVTNPDLGTLNISSIVSDLPSEFSVEPPTPVSVPPGGNTKFYVRFSPAFEGTRNANIVFAHNAPSSPDTIHVTGNGKSSILLSVHLNERWNMLSVPIKALNWMKDSIYPSSISSAFFHEGSYVKHDTLQYGKGFWLKFADSLTISMFGIPILLDTIQVSEGWNMIGSISKSVAVTDIGSEPPGIVTGNVFGYTTTYLPADSILPGHGYWLKTNQSGTIILSYNPLLLSAIRIKIKPSSELPPPPPGDEVLTNTIPKEFILEQAYPNPFNPNTTIKYQMPVDSRVSLKVYNTLGQIVATLIDDVESAGYKSVNFDGSNLTGGVYFYRIQADKFTDIKKMILIK